jgi:hypothetical protein
LSFPSQSRKQAFHSRSKRSIERYQSLEIAMLFGTIQQKIGETECL